MFHPTKKQIENLALWLFIDKWYNKSPYEKHYKDNKCQYFSHQFQIDQYKIKYQSKDELRKYMKSFSTWDWDAKEAIAAMNGVKARLE
jgi:hypothetical protein